MRDLRFSIGGFAAASFGGFVYTSNVDGFFSGVLVLILTSLWNAHGTTMAVANARFHAVITPGKRLPHPVKFVEGNDAGRWIRCHVVTNAARWLDRMCDCLMIFQWVSRNTVAQSSAFEKVEGQIDWVARW